ncbi:MAG: hypothetical protein RLZZ111_1333, partial [Planctomycetota bacterium]
PDIGLATRRQQQMVGDVTTLMDVEDPWRVHGEPVRQP